MQPSPVTAPAIKLRRRFQPLRGPVDLTALIDVVLLLLIFFMLSSTFIVQPGIRVEPPRSLFGPGAQANPLIITVLSDPAQLPAGGGPQRPGAFLFFQDQLMNLDELTAAIDRLPRSRYAQPFILKADKSVPLGLVTDIMNIAMARGFSVVIATDESAGLSTEP